MMLLRAWLTAAQGPFRPAPSQRARQLSSGVDLQAPVAIVGAGPTGLTLSCLLSQYGIPNLVLERSSALTQHPQAHFINNRTMEVFRGMEGLAEEVEASSPPLDQWRRFLYCQSMLGPLLGEVDHFAGQRSARQAAVSPVPVAHLSQHQLLPLLLARAQRGQERAGGRMLFGHAVQGIHLDRGSVLLRTAGSQAADSTVGAASCSPAAAAPGRPADEQLVRCRYLVAADGASSGVRRQLLVRMRGEDAMQHLINIHFRSPQLAARLLGAGRPAMLYFVMAREVVAVVVAHDLRAGEFVAQVPYFPPQQSLADFPPEVCHELVTAAAGGAALAPGIEVISARAWTMTAQLADTFQRGPIFLAGDAAHRFPPAGGFGMNTGIQDAHNLAWKLAAVLRGDAAEQLLGSYTPERRPVALANTALSVANWHEAVRVPAALGLDPQAAALLATAACMAPTQVAKPLLEGGLALGRALAAAATPLRAGAVEAILREGRSLRLQFPREDLGFVYAEGAVAGSSQARPGSGGADSGGKPGAGAGADAKEARGAPYEPRLLVGGRLPHFWLRVEGRPDPLSSLDVVGGRQPWPLLIMSGEGGPTVDSSGTGAAAAAGASAPKAASLAAAAQQLLHAGWPLNVLQIQPPARGPNPWGAAEEAARGSQGDGAHRNTWVEGAGEPGSGAEAQSPGGGWVCAAEDLHGSWGELASQASAGAAGPGRGSVGGRGSGGQALAVLVRPDEHVAWMATRHGPEGWEPMLAAALKDVLHWAGPAAAQHDQ